MTTNTRRLIEVMARLRDPEGGCPWDLEQDFASIAPYTIEEAYEVVDAIARGDLGQLKDELGDLLLQVVYHARMAEEAGLFDFDQVASAIADKMIRRHPHVFGSADIESARAQSDAWEAAKATERARKAGAEDHARVLDDVPDWNDEAYVLRNGRGLVLLVSVAVSLRVLLCRPDHVPQRGLSGHRPGEACPLVVHDVVNTVTLEHSVQEGREGDYHQHHVVVTAEH